MAEIFLGLKATVTGTEEIARLNAQLKKVGENELTTGQATDIARKRRSLATTELQRKNMITEAMIGKDTKSNFILAEQRVRFDQNRFALQEQNAVMDRAVWIQQEYGMSMKGSIEASKSMLLAEKELAIQEKMDLERKKQLALAEKSRRRELMQASIGMFVMGITMTQTLDTMSKMAGENKALAEGFKEMSQAVRFMLGPIQVVTSAMQFLNMENKKLMLTMSKFIFIFAGLFLLYKAFTSKSKELRFVLGLVAGMLITLNALLLVNTARTWAKTIADATGLSVSSLGAALPLIAAALAGGLALGFAAMATAPKGQNAPGYSRPVSETGLVYAHRGETISRIGSSQPDMGYMMNVNIYVPENSVVDTGMVDYMASRLEVINASGRGG